MGYETRNSPPGAEKWKAPASAANPETPKSGMSPEQLRNQISINEQQIARLIQTGDPENQAEIAELQASNAEYRDQLEKK